MKDQQKFEEYKSIKSQKVLQKVINEEISQVQTQPKINKLSEQITKMMDERKAESSNTRLFKYGTEKLLMMTKLDTKEA